MMTLQEAKIYLRVDEWHTDEDHYIEELIKMATAYVLKRIGRKSVRLIPEDDRPIAGQAVRLILAHYWRTRTEATEVKLHTIPLGAENLCQLIEHFNV